MFDDRLRILGEAHSVHTLTNRMVIENFYRPAETGNVFVVDVSCSMTVRVGDEKYFGETFLKQVSCQSNVVHLYWDEEIYDRSIEGPLIRETRNPIWGIKMGREWLPFYEIQNHKSKDHYLTIADLHSLDAVIRENRMLFWDRTNQHFWQYSKWGPSVIYMSEDYRTIDCYTAEYNRLDKEFHTDEATWSSTQYEYLAKEMDNE